ncbi:MAG: acyltransferase family protein [Trueperaceae bacterium]
MTDGRFGYLDGVRGLLALGVFLHHYTITYTYHLTGRWGVDSSFYKLCGEAGIAIFFMITGFLFWHRLLNKRGQLNWVALYTSRFFRIVPLYWFVVAIVVGLASFIQTQVASTSLWLPLFQWLFFTGMPDIYGFEGTYRMIAGVAWTLKYEWLFYFSLPIFAPIVRLAHKQRWLYSVLALFVLGLSGMSSTLSSSGIDTRFALFFLAGGVTAAVSSLERVRQLADHWLVSGLMLATLLGVFFFFDTALHPISALLLAMFFAPIPLGNSLFGFLRLPALIFLGDISYSLYLLHGLVIFVAFNLLLPSFMAQPLPPLSLWSGMAVLGIIIVFVSWATYSWIEKPFIQLGKTVTQRTSAPVAPQQ